MKIKPKETSRQIYIRLLTNLPRDPKADDMQFACELVVSGFLDGPEPIRDANGIFRQAKILGITVDGRLFLEKSKTC